MLLHDGIEIPCILEIKYTVEDKQPYRRGAEGMWLFTKEYPVMKSKFSMTIPIGRLPVYAASDDVPEPEIIMSEKNNQAKYTWTMGSLEGLPIPHTDAPAEYTPHLIWSTWDNWTEFGKYLGGVMKTAQTLDSGLTGMLDSLLVGTRIGPEKAGLIADFIEQRVAYTDYPEKYWRSSPRTAIRTYQTAYGHRLDRAILAAAMFEHAGLTAIPVFISKGFNGGNTAVPSLGRYGGIGVWVSGPDIEAYYDPAEDLLRRGLTYIIGRTLWSPGTEDKPGLRIKGTNEHSRMDIIIDMTIDSASDTISGRGFLLADNGLNVFDQMEGLSDEAISFLESSMNSLIDGIEITDFSFSRFDLFNVTCGFDFKMKKPDDDDYGRLALEIGDPAGGLFEHLPEDIKLYENKRLSPVNLQCLMQQKVEFRFRLKGMEAVYLPSAQQIENKAGRFSLTVDNGEQLIAVNRELSFPAATYDANIWPDMRILLLADSHRKNRIMLFKEAEDSAE